MADNDNTFLTADNLYEDVEGEAGKNLNLEQNQKQNLVGIIQSRFYQAEDARNTDERGGYVHTKTIEVYITSQ
jgi:hypothetical protein